MADQKKAYAFGLLAVLLWSTVASAFKISLRYLDHFQLLLYSCCFSLIALGTILAARGQVTTLFHYSRKELLHTAILGCLNPFLYYLILFKAYDLLRAQEAQPLNYTWAFTLMLLSVPILGQRLSIKVLIAGLISYSGVWVIATEGKIWTVQFTSPLGVALALISTVVWALYWLFNTRSPQNPPANLFLNFLFALPLIAVTCLLFSSPIPTQKIGLLGAAYVGFFEMGITFLFWLLALQHAETTAKIGNLIFLSPFISLVFIHFLVGERILTSTYLGLVLIVLGLIVQHDTRKTT